MQSAGKLKLIFLILVLAIFCSFAQRLFFFQGRAVLWRAKIKGFGIASPMVKENIIYLTTGYGYLHALDSQTGKNIWQFQTKTSELIEISPLIRGKTLYFASWNRYIYAVDINGQLCWETRIDSQVRQKPSIVDERLFCGTMGGLYVLNQTDGKIQHILRLAISTDIIADSTF